MKKRSKILTILVPCGLLIVLLSIRTAVAYLLDTDDKYNAVSFGKVSVRTVENDDYTDAQVLAAGGTVKKEPAVENNGESDEYVFCCVAVPKKNVTLLYEKTEGTHKEGTPVGAKANCEIFRMLADGVTGQATPTNVDSTLDKPQFDFFYNAADSGKEGWVYLQNDTSATDYDKYYFAYNKRLLKNGKTIPVFNKVQLKSFIDEEINAKANAETHVLVTAYGIQADSLGIASVDSLAKDAVLNKTQLESVFAILNNKGRVS